MNIRVEYILLWNLILVDLLTKVGEIFSSIRIN